MTRLVVSALAAALMVPWVLTPVSHAAAQRRCLGVSEVIHDIRVTLLEARRLAGAERRMPDGVAADGLYVVFHVENRPGVPILPVLGEVKVTFGDALYNPVTNATSSKPFAPGIIIHGVERFVKSRGTALRGCLPAPRPNAKAGILEVFVYGGPIRPGATGVVELEQGAQPEDTTYDPAGYPKALDHTRIKYVWFRFQIPPLS